MPELPPDAAVDDEVDGGVEDEEDVVGGEEEVEGHGHGVAAQLVAQVVVVLRLRERMKRLVNGSVIKNYVFFNSGLIQLSQCIFVIFIFLPEP